ncbi:PREDICTED: sulfhydryl oxidase 1-like [Cyprinodon variegatus]|uniref:Sulfhydryl oxidase n=1 Tax=Cyprinodon variegatus TaxID=28743 RepID=A0A3Q2EIF0_CYPVA|nr:PREDICTED: sulfhydryl oxidase 1-like [Cyprinodon variegatus]
MARRSGRATSRFIKLQEMNLRMIAALFFFVCLAFPPAAEAGLYTASDQIVLLSQQNVGSVLVNSSAATVVEFYASWCGHCISFSPIYKKLARDIKEWKPAVNIAAVDCAADENIQICMNYKISGYPTIKFFHAYSTADSAGVPYRGFSRDVRNLRQRIIDSLESHGEPWPPACPPLEPTSETEINNFFETNTVQHLALIFEDAKSYIGREVILDLLQFENVTVRRVLNTESGLVAKLGVTEFPSCYLYYPDGNFTRLRVNFEARAFYSYALQRLPGVIRSGKPPPVTMELVKNSTQEPWRPFDRSRVYMADLESALHHSLRVELAVQSVIKGDSMIALKSYISVLAKYFPGRPVVMNLLKSLNSWLKNQTVDQISYKAFKENVDNTAQVPDAALPEGVRWVGCQGSQPHFRGYPCGVWTLFHVLTVQASNTGDSDPQEVLTAMRNYIHSFFGCRYCADHFENMARESLEVVNTLPSSVLWLWSRHNRVNNRIAGDLSEDPYFPKIQWPSPEVCPSCHMLKDNGEHGWNENQVLTFLGSYFSSSRILLDYLEDENKILKKQTEKHSHKLEDSLAQKHIERIAREALDPITTPVEEEEEEEEPQDETEAYEEDNEGGEDKLAASDIKDKAFEQTPRTNAKLEEVPGHQQAHKIPSIIGMRLKQRRQQEDIVDLDSFVNQHFKAKALQLAASSRVKQRTLQTKVEQEHRQELSLGMELDAGLGMIGLQPIDTDLDLNSIYQGKRLKKRELAGQYIGKGVELFQRGHWISVLSIGFSNVDISLCVILYAVSFTCLVAMYIFFRNRFRRRRVKIALP